MWPPIEFPAKLKRARPSALARWSTNSAMSAFE
jgi:hypothetical protein